MRTVRFLGAAAAALLVSTAIAGTAVAKDGFYVAPSLGLIMPDTLEVTDGTDSLSFDSDNGWAFFAAAGYRFGQFRIEGELGYGELNGGEVTLNNVSTDVEFDQSLFTGSVAGYVDFAAGSFTPYVGAGLGFITAEFDTEDDDFDLGSDTSFMMFGEAGVGFAVSETVSIVPSYRYMWVNDGGDGVDDSTAHILRVGLRYGF